MIDETGQAARPMGDYVRILRRGWWIVVATVVVVTGATYALSSLQTPAYQATADDLINVQNIFSSSKTSSSNSKDAQFYATTQAALADNISVAREALALAHMTGAVSASKLLADSTVTADPTTSVVEFKVTYRTKAGAVKLANAYGRAFANQINQQIKGKVQQLLNGDHQQLSQLAKSEQTVQAQIVRDNQLGLSPSQDYARLRELDKQIGSVQDDITSLNQATVTGLGGASLQNPAVGAAQLAPNTTRNSIVGLLLGIVIGVGLAFVREAFDTRVHSADEAAAMLGLPLLGRLPRPGKDLRRADRLALMVEPGGLASEAYRKLRVSLDFANLDPQAKVIVTTSAVAQEGKSTTAANLAVAIAASGKRVILVDLDLRAPYVDRFFGLTGRGGLTHVILGQVPLDDALVPIVVPGPTASGLGGNGSAPQQPRALLHVLPAGDAPDDPAALLSSQRLRALLEELRDRADVVIVDTPPVLPVSDTLSLLGQADGFLVVSKLELVRRKMLHELRRELEQANAVGLGVIVTDAEADSTYYGYGSGGYAQPAATHTGAAR